MRGAFCCVALLLRSGTGWTAVPVRSPPAGQGNRRGDAGAFVAEPPVHKHRAPVARATPRSSGRKAWCAKTAIALFRWLNNPAKWFFLTH